MAKNKDESLLGVLNRAVKKKATGYKATETVEEYALVDGEMTLIKKKVKYTDVPPDVSAIRLMLEIGSEKESDMTEEEIKKEKQRLIGLLLEVENATDKKQQQV